MSKKRRHGTTPEHTTTPLLPDPVIKHRDATVQSYKKLKKNDLLRRIEKLVETFENDHDKEQHIEEPGTEKEVDEITHRRMPNVTFRMGSKS